MSTNGDVWSQLFIYELITSMVICAHVCSCTTTYDHTVDSRHKWPYLTTNSHDQYQDSVRSRVSLSPGTYSTWLNLCFVKRSVWVLLAERFSLCVLTCLVILLVVCGHELVASLGLASLRSPVHLRGPPRRIWKPGCVHPRPDETLART